MYFVFFGTRNVEEPLKMNHKNNRKMKNYIALFTLLAGIFGQMVLAGPSATLPEYTDEATENASEINLRLEAWMLEPGIMTLSREIEKDPQLESWMLEIKAPAVMPVSDAEIELEDWMVEIAAETTEADIEFENWMITFQR